MNSVNPPLECTYFGGIKVDAKSSAEYTEHSSCQIKRQSSATGEKKHSD